MKILIIHVYTYVCRIKGIDKEGNDAEKNLC